MDINEDRKMINRITKKEDPEKKPKKKLFQIFEIKKPKKILKKSKSY